MRTGEQPCRAAKHVIVCALALTPQETACRQPGEAGRAARRAGRPAGAGDASRIRRPLAARTGPRAGYAAILDRQLPGTGCGRAARTAMFARQIAGGPAVGLARRRRAARR